MEKNYELYLESLEKPQPFYIGTPAIQDNALNLNWDVSYDFDAEDITYTVELATDYQFQNVIFRQEGVAVPEVQTKCSGSRPVLCTGTCNRFIWEDTGRI